MGLNINCIQIKALLKKDILVRLRQPWMTIVQILWPCVIFVALYILRNRFVPAEIGECQFRTRLLPSKNNILPFFHSYICNIDNACISPTPYEEESKYEHAPLKPILNIVETFINDDTLYKTVVDLPVKSNFITAVTTLTTHSKFKYIEENIGKVVASVPEVENMLGSNFDITKLFSNDMMFSNAGKIICGKPFPRNDNIRYVNNILYTEDYNGPNKVEVDAMPTKYCKQLYLDITSTNNGKITWNQVKPIIQGKIVYAPDNEENAEIMKLANTTFDEMGKLLNLATALNTALIKLRTDEKFKSGYEGLRSLLKSPLILSLLGDSVDIKAIDNVMNRIATDDSIADIIRTVMNILECFSVDRFIPAKSHEDLENKAIKLNEKRLFYLGIVMNDTSKKEVNYAIRMDIDNTPITIENRNRFWFPGPDANFGLEMRYHRGFIQVKHAIDTAIIKFKKRRKDKQNSANVPTTTEAAPKTTSQFNLFDSTDNDFLETSEPNSTTTESSTIMPDRNEAINASVPVTEAETIDTSTSLEPLESDNDITADEDEVTTTPATLPNERNKRSPQLDGAMGFFASLFAGDSSKKKVPVEVFEVDKIRVHTKQMPYQKYTKDDFKKGLYLAQSVQMAFFIALIVQVATCIRHRVWMKESKNTLLMRTMGLNSSSELTTWALVTFLEILIVIILACIILYSGGILKYTNLLFILIFLFVFGLSVISFCYLCSTLFTMASISSVGSAILFLITFMPYIIIVALGKTMSGFLKFLTNLSMSTAFCYAWNHIMRMELQDKGMTFKEGFIGNEDNEFRYAFCMMFVDILLYAVIGYFIDRIRNDEFKFHKVIREDIDASIGAIMQNVSMVYNTGKVAVSNVSIVFPRDHITCMLGRNGAGKSTIIKMLTGQLKPTMGRISLSRGSCEKHNSDEIGLCAQDNILIPQLTAREHLEMYARIKLKSGFQLEVARTMKNLNFGKYENYEASKLSGGYQRRLCVAIAFIGSPNLVILDEPCSAVDTKARRCVWELIETLRKGRAVVLATHYLDEAEYLSDSVFILNESKVIVEHNPKSLKELFTNSFEIVVTREEENQNELMDDVQMNIRNFVKNFTILESSRTQLKISIPFNENDQHIECCSKLVEYLEEMRNKNHIRDFSLGSKNLAEIFSELNKAEVVNGDLKERYLNIDLEKKEHRIKESISRMEIIRNLFWKRFLHFKRNYKLMLCILILPTIFEILAMGFMQLRPGGDHDTILPLTRDLYKDSTQFLSLENRKNFTESTINEIKRTCLHCKQFPNSQEVYQWILDTHQEFHMKRYGGISFNHSNAFIWYNNKGYHSMIAWLNDLNSYMLKATMEDFHYEITTLNHPIKLDEKELSMSSILQQVADAGIALILLIAFSLVVAGASVYIVNERVSGEKLQQKLCGVNFQTYWSVSYIWDFLVYFLAMILCVIIFKIFDIPMYVGKSNLNGICLMLFLYGFATIPAVHLFEKMFAEASFANMTLFCLNVVVALTTLTVILLFDILGNSDEAEWWRNLLNRIFLIFPQHALADGLIEICKNHLVFEMFKRYYIDAYKSPVSSTLLRQNFIALFVMGVLFMSINYAIESGILRTICTTIKQRNRRHYDLEIGSIQTYTKTDQKYYNCSSPRYTLKVDSLCKAYKRKDYAVKNVSFEVRKGECFGLLGNNGAGKSTIFGMLSGKLAPTSGTIQYTDENISFCPQTSALDPLLTVREVITFYGNLRRIVDVPLLVSSTMKSFHLDDYENVLVRNLSGGNRRKLNVAVACFGDTSIVLMDEPTSDMDPVTRSLVYDAIGDLVAEERSVLLTSHTVSEIDNICHRIGILKDGHLLTVGSPKQLKEKFGRHYIVTVFYDKVDALTIERDIRSEFPQCNDIQTHSHSLKFLVQIKLKKNDMDCNDISEDDGSLPLSELLSKLNKFCTERSIQFTIAKCQLDKTFESILETSVEDSGHFHKSFVQLETIT